VARRDGNKNGHFYLGWALLDTGVCLLQTTTSSGAKMAGFIFLQQSPMIIQGF
jgi:hypothetical protein